MKRFTPLFAALFLLGLNSFSQDVAYGGRPVYILPASNSIVRNMDYELQHVYSHPVKKATLREAQLISDVVTGYPVNWISSYVSVEISAVYQGKEVKAKTTNTMLSAKQKKILTEMDLADNITINVKYRYMNPVTAAIEKGTMYVLITVAPEKEAEYTGGYEQLKKYLRENGLDKIVGGLSKSFKGGQVRFTVNEDGSVSNAKIRITTGDPKADELLIDCISKMPKWKPAEGEKGTKVKQEFRLNVGNVEGC